MTRPAADATRFPTDPAGLPLSADSDVVDVPDGGSVSLRIAPVAKRIGDATVRMLSYNGSVPGPTGSSRPLSNGLTRSDRRTGQRCASPGSTANSWSATWSA